MDANILYSSWGSKSSEIEGSVAPENGLFNLIMDCQNDDLCDLINKLKIGLSQADFKELFNQKATLLKILSIYPEGLLNLESEDNYSMLGQKHIMECACADFARNKKFSRKTTEEGLLSLIQLHFNNLDELRIMSLGSGGCFQELVIHAKITTNLNKKILWTLVDPIMFVKQSPRHEFDSLISVMSPGSTVNVIRDDQEAITMLQNNQCDKPHIILNIDSRLGNPKRLHFRDGKVDTALGFFKEAISKMNFTHILTVLDGEEHCSVFRESF